LTKKLFYLKITHTIIWVFYVLLFFYILYAAIINRLDVYFWIAVGFEIIEVIILAIFKGICPLTILGRNYTDNPEVGFDIYLPKWLAKYNKIIYGTGLALVMILIIYRVTKM